MSTVGARTGQGSDNLVLNGTTSTFNVTFDRPMQVRHLHARLRVLQIMGPTGSISGPQFFSNNAVNQTIPKATTTAPGTLSQTLTVPDYNGTFTVANVTVSLNITDAKDSSLSAVLIAPNGTQVALFSNVGGSGQNFTSPCWTTQRRRRSPAARRRLPGRISQRVSCRAWSA